MLSEAYELFGCNTAELYVISVNYGDTDLECIAFDETYGIEFPCISGVEGGGTVINNTYGIGAYPTYILIAPNHDIVEQDMWPISSVQTFIDYFESHGIEQTECATLAASFTSDYTEICETDAVQFTDESWGNIISWNWVFEGGEPASSTEQNPVVVYNEEGSYDVELTVSDGINSSTLLMNDYVTVLMTPPAMLMPFGDVCIYWPAFQLTGGSPAGGVYSGPGVTNGWFYPASAGIGTHEITYTYTAFNGCDNSASQTILVDPCTGTGEIYLETVHIFPNPSRGSFTISMTEPVSGTITVTSMLGEQVYSIQTSDGSREIIIHLEGCKTGLYFVQVHTDKSIHVKKIKLVSE